MAFILKQNGAEIADSKIWNARLFGDMTKTSFPLEVPQDYVWENEGYWLGWIPDPEPSPITPEQQMQALVSLFIDSVQSHLDAKSMEKGYDNIVSACSYAAAPNPFQAESISFVTWRGNVWAYCYQELAKVQSGERPVPDVMEFINELPVFE
jgi:hypothetical protein